MALASHSRHVQTNLDLTWDTRYPRGDKPLVQPATLGVDTSAFNAALIDLTRIRQGVPTSINYRQYLTGTSASTATLTVNAITGTLGNWQIDAAGNSLANSGVSGGSGSLQVVAADGAGNSASFPVQSWAILISSQQQRIKSNFGLYIYLDRNMSTASKQGRMDYFGTKTAVKGFQDVAFWSKFENPNLVGGAAQYDGSWDSSGNSGFAYVDAMLAKCAAMSPPRHWMMHLSTYGFAGSGKPTTFPSSFMPTYLGGSTYGANTAASNGLFGGAWINCYASGLSVAYFARFWNAAVMDRLIALMQAYGARYDGHPLFEMVSCINESTTPTQTGYTDAAAITQYLRYFPAGYAAFPTTQRRFWGNYLQDSANCKQLIDAAIASYWAIGGPDCVNETGTNPRAFPFNRAYRGINPVTLAVDPTYTNYVGKGVWVAEFEPDEMMPRSGAAGPATFGSNNWTDYVAQALQQGTQYTTCFDNTYGGNNDKRMLTSPSGSHPDALDYFTSVFAANGGNVNGAQANITLPMFPPLLWPTG